MIIAIDGPSGVGKGTVARAVASALGIRHVDTGAMYRALAWRAEQLGLSLDDEDQMAQLAASATIEIDGSDVRIDGADASHAIRTPEIDRATTRVARLARVRAALVARQRDLAEPDGVVMEGRDIGTAVFPNADVKIYLDASPEERARRRAHDPSHTSSQTQALADIAQAMQRRDDSDRTRQASPLCVAPDAITIDTTHLQIEQVVERVLRIVTATRETAGRDAS
ncbi:MAG: (d)CMP kinase [Acidobacteria bacterium]|nr:(d)CMP kinase [Acidobacteriota bacterium]